MTTTHRVYLSVRIAATGLQIADITRIQASEQGESDVERLNNWGEPEMTRIIRKACYQMWGDTHPLLFVYMKEAVK